MEQITEEQVKKAIDYLKENKPVPGRVGGLDWLRKRKKPYLRTIKKK